MKPIQLQKNAKNEVNFEILFLLNRAVAAAGARKIRIGSKNRPKIYARMRSRGGGFLVSIFVRFWWVWGSKLGGKID